MPITKKKKERYFVSKYKLFAGTENPNPDEYKEVTFDEFCVILSLVEYAWGGWYNIYKE